MTAKKFHLENSRKATGAVFILALFCLFLSIGSAPSTLANEQPQPDGTGQPSSGTDDASETSENTAESDDRSDVEKDIDFLMEALDEAQNMSAADAATLAKEIGSGENLLVKYQNQRKAFGPAADLAEDLNRELTQLLDQAQRLASQCQQGRCPLPRQCAAVQETKQTILQIQAQLNEVRQSLLVRLIANTNFIAVQKSVGGETGSAEYDTRVLSDLSRDIFVKYSDLIPAVISELDGCLARNKCEPVQAKISVLTSSDFGGEKRTVVEDGIRFEETIIDGNLVLAGMIREVARLASKLRASLAEIKARSFDDCPPEDSDTAVADELRESTGRADIEDNDPPKSENAAGGKPAAAPMRFVPLVVTYASDSSKFCEFRDGNPIQSTVRMPVAATPRPAPPRPERAPTGGKSPTESQPRLLTSGERAPCEDLPGLLALAIKLQAEIANPAAFKIAREFAQTNLNAVERRIDELKKICPRPADKALAELPPCEEIELLAALLRDANRRALSAPNLSAEERGAAKAEIALIERRIAGINCPRDLAGIEKPPAGETRPFPVPVTGEPFLPIPAGLDPCVELDLLRIRQANANRVLDDPAAPAFALAIARKRLIEIETRISELTPQCAEETPPASAQDNEPPANEEPETPSAPIQVTFFVKASTEAIRRGANAENEIAGQQVKLFADSVLNVDLPGEGKPKPQDDHDRDPIQGVTDENGELRLNVGAAEIAESFDNDVTTPDFNETPADMPEDSIDLGPEGDCDDTSCISIAELADRLDLKPEVIAENLDNDISPITDFKESPADMPEDAIDPEFKGDCDDQSCNSIPELAGRLELNIDVTKESGTNLLVDGVLDPGLLPSLLAAYKSSEQKIGDKTLLVFTFPAEQEALVEAELREAFPNAIIEINLCRVKEPLAPKPDGYFSPVPPEAELRGASIDLSLSNLEQGQ